MKKFKVTFELLCQYTYANIDSTSNDHMLIGKDPKELTGADWIRLPSGADSSCDIESNTIKVFQTGCAQKSLSGSVSVVPTDEITGLTLE
jgi:hypothetical protein